MIEVVFYVVIAAGTFVPLCIIIASINELNRIEHEHIRSKVDRLLR